MVSTPSVGSIVIFYRLADINSRGIPSIVQEIMHENPAVLGLSLIADRRTDLLVETLVRHVTDPLLSNERQRKYGGWDTIEAHEARRQERKRQQAEQVQSEEESRRQRAEKQAKEEEFYANEIAEMFSKGMPAVDIADQMNRKHGGNWTFQRVNGLLKRKKVLQPA